METCRRQETLVLALGPLPAAGIPHQHEQVQQRVEEAALPGGMSGSMSSRRPASAMAVRQFVRMRCARSSSQSWMTFLSR